MKPIEGIELSDAVSAAKAQILKAQNDKLVSLLVKTYEERDTLVANMKKEEEAYEKKKKENQNKLSGIEGKITKIEAGEWDVIKEDNKGQAQPQGDGKGGDGGDKNKGKPEQA
jgi:hypothetical protein